LINQCFIIRSPPAHGYAQAGWAKRQRIRQDRGLTQEQLAERSGFSQQYISGLEQGRRNLTIVSIYELATALGVSHMELVRSAADE
jgi:predicted transcriptional regulator